MTEHVPTIPSFAQERGRALFAWLREMRDRRPVWRDRWRSKKCCGSDRLSPRWSG
jgi:hypothetical protein